jgi:hypothetical protein
VKRSPLSTVCRNDDAFSVTVGECSTDRVTQPAGYCACNSETIHYHQNFLRAAKIDLARSEIIQVEDFDIDADAQKPLRTKILHDDSMSDEIGEAKRECNVDACAVGKREDRIDD